MPSWNWKNNKQLDKVKEKVKEKVKKKAGRPRKSD
jgi:hypothetical protein